MSKLVLADRLRRLAPSATMAVMEKARQLRERGVDVVSFGAGEPDFDTPEDIKLVAMQALRDGDTKYPSPASGKPELRRAICDYVLRHCGVRYEPPQVCVTVGAKDALHLAFLALLNRGDEVLIPIPAWVSYPDQVRLADGEPVLVEGDRANMGKVSGAAIRKAVSPRTRLLVLNNPCNPTGAVYSREELEDIASAIRDTSLFVISDEIYHRLIFSDAPCVSFAALDEMRERTLIVNGCSKTFAMTGWRLGFALGPSPLIQAMATLQGQTTSGAASFTQTAAVAALALDHPSIEPMRQAYARRGARMAELLSAIPGVVCPRPQGAFYCFADVSGVLSRLGARDADAFAEAVLEQAHVAVVSGRPFGWDTHVRLSFATSDERIEEGMRRLTRLLR